MSDLHPNWQATDGESEEQALPVHVAEKKPVQEPTAPAPQPPHAPRMRRLSRQPAAVAGMLLAVSIGASLYFSFDRGSDVTVHITDKGFSPSNVTVTTGGQVRWINDTDRPHVLQSDVLCTGDQECFTTSAIAPQASTTLTITPDFRAGTYAYYSITTQGMEAHITVLAGSAAKKHAQSVTQQQNLAQAVPFASSAQSSVPPATAGGTTSSSSRPLNVAFAFPDEGSSAGLEFTDITAPLMGGIGNDGSAVPPSGDDALFSFPSASSASSRTGPSRVTQLPVNPYTVNGTRTHPFDAQGKPITAGSTSSQKSQKSTLHAGAPRPITQPETGPALWITLTGTILLLLLGTRSLMRRVYIE